MNSTSLTNPTENSSNFSIMISTQQTPLPSDLTIAEQQLLGSILISVILICVIAYIPVLWTLLKTKHFNQHFAYRLLIQMGFFEIFYLCFYFQNCVMLIFNIDFGRAMGVIIMACRTSAWFMLNLMTLVLAINRFDVIVGFLSCQMASKKRLFKSLLLLCYILSLLLLTVYLIPGFQAESIKFSSLRDPYNKQYVAQTITDIVFGLNIITIVFYVMTIAHLVIMKLKMSSVEAQNFVKHEWRLFIQAFIICGYKSGLFFLWTYVNPSTKFVYCIYWFLNVFELGYNPFMYYAMNRTLRREIKQLLCSSSSENTTTVQVISTKTFGASSVIGPHLSRHERPKIFSVKIE